MARMSGPEAFRHIGDTLLERGALLGGVCLEIGKLASFSMWSERPTIDYETADAMEGLILDMQQQELRYHYVWARGKYPERRALLCYFLAEIMESL